jgi:hypothetical protein
MSSYTETLAGIKNRTAFSLATDAECVGPDTATSAGAVFLTSVRDAFVEAIEDGGLVAGEDDDSGRISEIANNAPDVYTATKWAEFVDLAAWQEESDTSDLVEADASMDDKASVCLYIIAERLCHTLLAELAGARNEDNETDKENQA